MAAALFGSGACAASPLMHAAASGDETALGRQIAARERGGTLSNEEAASIAKEVASRDLRAASAVDAPALVRDALPCAHELDDALGDRMRIHDAAGADAALARIEGRGLSLGNAREFATDPDARWRSVGARTLVRREDRDGRLRALADDSPLVRRQAARAAADAADSEDLAALIDAARLDPEPLVRTEAVRSIAALPPAPAGNAVDALRDLWTSAGVDDALRGDMALAWASPSLWDAGGRDALDVLVAAGHGVGAIEGAAAVLRHRGAQGDVVDAAAGQMTRSIASGSRRARLQAIAEAPLERREVLDAIRSAATDDDLEVRVGALSRLASAHSARSGHSAHDSPPTSDVQTSSAVAALEALAQPGSPIADRARFALAAAGDRRVQSWLESALTAPAADARLEAATALATLGASARAAPLLADGDAAVRVRSACTILMAARVAR